MGRIFLMKNEKVWTSNYSLTRDPWERNDVQENVGKGTNESLQIRANQICGSALLTETFSNASASNQNIADYLKDNRDLPGQQSLCIIDDKRERNLLQEKPRNPSNSTLWDLPEVEPILESLKCCVNQVAGTVNEPVTILRNTVLQGTLPPHLDIGVYNVQVLEETLASSNDTGLSSAEPPKRAASQRTDPNSSRKRSRTSAVECDSQGELGGKTASTADAAFACPFYRRFPIRHMDCVNRKLMRIRDVKQHIQRRHTRDFCYCPACSENLYSELDGDHSASSRQGKQHGWSTSNCYGVSQQAQKKLKYRVNRTQPLIEQWYSIWDIIFVSERRPDKPYLGTMVEETSGMISDFWSQEATQIMPDFLRTQNLPAVFGGPLAQLMEALFREVSSRFQMKMLGFSCSENGWLNNDGNSALNDDKLSLFWMGINPSSLVETQQGSLIPGPSCFQSETPPQLAAPLGLSDYGVPSPGDHEIFGHSAAEEPVSVEGMAVPGLTNAEFCAGFSGYGLQSTMAFDQNLYWGTEHRPPCWRGLNIDT